VVDPVRSTVQVTPFQAVTVKLPVELAGAVATVPDTTGFWMITTLVAVAVSVPVELPNTTASSPTAMSEKPGEVTPRSVYVVDPVRSTVQVEPLQAVSVKLPAELAGAVATVPTTTGFWMIDTLMASTVFDPVLAPFTDTSSPTATFEKVGELTPGSV
jgi:hypothetical protein